jgi:NADPH:quinone reductase
MAVQLKNRKVTLASRPEGFPKESDFQLDDEDDVGEPGTGEVLVRTLWLSVDPYQRGRMSEARSYARSLELGDVITSQAVGEVVESSDPRYEPGDHVVGPFGWQEHAVARAGTLRKVVPGVPLQANLHVLGTNGLTAYFGLFDIGQPRPGDTVVVSAAAGAVGQLVGQLAKLAGCRAVGIAGGEEKKRELGETFGYDAAIDYKNDDVRATLKEACPDGVDVYFDNVGGEISAAVHSRLNAGARIAVCGQISQYNLEKPEPTFHPGLLIVFRARMQGFLVSDYASRFGEALPRVARWLASGELRYTEDVTEGLENAPDAFLRMLRGENRGKTLVKLR